MAAWRHGRAAVLGGDGQPLGGNLTPGTGLSVSRPPRAALSRGARRRQGAPLRFAPARRPRGAFGPWRRLRAARSWPIRGGQWGVAVTRARKSLPGAFRV